MQENMPIPNTDSRKDLLFFTLLGLAIAIIVSILFAIIIHGAGSGGQPFIRETGTLPRITITVINSDENSIVDLYLKLYYSDLDARSDDIRVNGIKLRATTENNVLYLDPNLLDQGKGYLAIEVVEPHGYSIQDFKGSDVEAYQAAQDDSILIADLGNTDRSLHEVAVQINLSPAE